ncbi:MAG: diadenylate cyclase [Bacilli bacterium]|nr:diadenylate cyclase [Bacilli bacterium]
MNYDFTNPQNLIVFLSILALFGLLDVFVFWLFKRIAARIYVVAIEVVFIIFWLFSLTVPCFIMAFALAVGIIVLFLANPNEGRGLLANNMKGQAPRGGFFRAKARPESLFDRDAMYKKIETAVITMSKQKVGAIISFEMHDNLDDVMKSGTRIDAPVSAELLQTIFYPGTRLHDGAVIVRNDKIVAASVYYTPTTRPLTGKFGSRHRAAIGISEACDAVTVVVSEETGRISIAYKGELETVGPDMFNSRFSDYMSLALKTQPED